MRNFRYLIILIIFLTSPYAFAHGDIKLVMYSIAVVFQLLTLMTLLILLGGYKKQLLIGNLLNIALLWLLPWRDTKLAAYYIILNVEPIILLIISLVISKLINWVKRRKGCGNI